MYKNNVQSPHYGFCKLWQLSSNFQTNNRTILQDLMITRIRIQANTIYQLNSNDRSIIITELAFPLSFSLNI